MVEALASVVESELALLEVVDESVGVHASQACQSGLGVAPEAFDAVDVVAADVRAAELALAVIDAKMFLVADVYQPVVALPAVGADDGVQGHFAAYCPQNNVFRAVGDRLGVDVSLAFVDAKDRDLPCGAPGTHALDAARSEVRLINLDGAGEGLLVLTRLGHEHADAGQQTVGGVAVEAGELRDLHGRQADGHMPQEPAENSLGDSRTHHVAVLHSFSAYPGTSGRAQIVMTLDHLTI